MTQFNKVTAKIVLVASLIAISQLANAGVAVITNPAVKEIGLSKSKLADIYLGKLKRFANGTKIQPVDLPTNNDAHKKFYSEVIQKSDSTVNRYWAKLKFSGKGTPPKVIDDPREVIRWVSNNKGAVGYIDGKYLNKSVKVVLILP